MSDELFPAEQVAMDSPKIAWMKKHEIITWRHPGDEYGMPPSWFAGYQDWWPDKSGADFFCEETSHHGDSRCVEADTESDALALIAKYSGLKLWNEEGS